MTGPFETLGRSIREPLGDGGPDPHRRESQRRRLLSSVEGRRVRARRRVWVGAGALAAAGAAAVLLLLLLPDPGQPMQCRIRGGDKIEEGEWVEAKDDRVTFEFSEGSAVTLARGSRARLRGIKHDQVQVVLESGRLRADIASGHNISWTYQAGPYRVHVLGTVLGVLWDADTRVLEVDVTRGSVKVSGGNIHGSGITVGAGQRVKADLSRREVRLFRPDRRDNAPAAPQAPARVDAEATSTSDLPPSPQDTGRPRRNVPARWKQLARAGEYAAAVSAARQTGWRRVLQQSGPWDTLLLADAARLSRQYRLARSALASIRKRFPGQEPAAMAAFRLGRLAFDHERDHGEAAKWFQRFLHEAPRSALVQGARGRLMISLQRAGDAGGATRTASEYLTRHPGGSYAAAARSILAGGRPR